ncbi:MAG: hypothetical protein ABSA67_11590 [Candidatus Brocadiia bacterium]|jgi:hypothetical protein
MAGQTRREFLRTAARTAALFGLGAIAWIATGKSGGQGPDGARPRFPCERCPALSSCSQADSLQARDALGPRARTENPARDIPPRRLCVDP